MNGLLDYAAVVVGAYLLGALPTGYLLGRFAKGVDVRRYGSGSTGATNVLRILGWGAAALVFVGDFGKGFLAVWGAGELGAGPLAQALGGLAVLAGHNWPVFLGFRGGRGVASGVGGLFATFPIVAAFVLTVALAVIAVSRYVSLGSVVGTALAIPLCIAAVLLGLGRPEYLVYVIPGVTLILLRHWGNLQRLASGTEHKLGQSISVEQRPAARPKRSKARPQHGRAPVA